MEKTFPTKKWRSLPSGNPYRLSSISDSSPVGNETPAASQEATDSPKLDGFNLFSSAKRQAELYWHLQPYFSADGEPKFDTALALKEYYQFLKLMKEYPDQTLVPTYLIDLYWHTHMTGGSVEDYSTDCKSICERFIDHDDEYGDGDREGVLGQAFESTAKLWEKAYGDSTYKENGGYRGPPPEDYYWNVCPDYTNGIYSLKQMPDEVAETVNKASKVERNKPRRGLSDICSFECFCCMVIIILLVIGVACFLLGGLLTSVEYACEDAAPSQAELDFRKSMDPSIPVCLTTSIRDEVMCLQAGTTDNAPPRYCHTNVAEEQAGQRDWYLWWSPCTKCGTAWRMNPVVDHDKSFYKLPAEDLAELPLGTLYWQQWHPSRAVWLGGSPISIEECESVSNPSGIPSACYVEKRFNGLRRAGLVFMLLAPAFLILGGCFVLCDPGTNSVICLTKSSYDFERA